MINYSPSAKINVSMFDTMKNEVFMIHVKMANSGSTL